MELPNGYFNKGPFPSNFRKMLTLEQYRNPKLAQLHHDYLAGDPLEYMAVIFRMLADSEQKILSLKLNSQTLRRSADRKADHALCLIYFEGRSYYGFNYLHHQHWKYRAARMELQKLFSTGST